MEKKLERRIAAFEAGWRQMLEDRRQRAEKALRRKLKAERVEIVKTLEVVEVVKIVKWSNWGDLKLPAVRRRRTTGNALAGSVQRGEL